MVYPFILIFLRPVRPKKDKYMIINIIRRTYSTKFYALRTSCTSGLGRRKINPDVTGRINIICKSVLSNLYSITYRCLDVQGVQNHKKNLYREFFKKKYKGYAVFPLFLNCLLIKQVVAAHFRCLLAVFPGDLPRSPGYFPVCNYSTYIKQTMLHRRLWFPGAVFKVLAPGFLNLIVSLKPQNQ
jgi:hypothetical protein